MTDQETGIPTWVENLMNAMTELIEFKSPAGLDGRYLEPEDPDDFPVVELAPSVAQNTHPGPFEGDLTYGLLHSFDILAAQEAFDEVDEMLFGLESDGKPYVSIECIFQGNDVVLQVYTVPFSDMEEFDDDEEDEEEDDEDDPNGWR